MTSRTKIIAAGLSAFSFCALNCQAFADPLASSSLARKSGFSDSTQMNDIHNVQLLVDIKTGLELNQIRTLIPTAKVLEKSGKVFVYVTQTRNARTAYNLGKSLQDKFNITFNLAYSEGHPDLNLAWMKPLANIVATKAIPVRPTGKSSLKEVKPSSEIPNTAYLTKDIQLISSAEEADSFNSQQPLLRETSSDKLTQNNVSAQSEPIKTQSLVLESKDIQLVSSVEEAGTLNSQQSLLREASSDKLTQNNVSAQSEPIEAQSLVLEDTAQDVKSNLADASNVDVQSGLALSTSETIASILHKPENNFDPSSESFTTEKVDKSNAKDSQSFSIASSNTLDDTVKKKQRKSISETLKELRSINFSGKSEINITLAGNKINQEALLTSETIESEKLFTGNISSLDINESSDIDYVSSDTASTARDASFIDTTPQPTQISHIDTTPQSTDISDLPFITKPGEFPNISSSVVDTYEDSNQSVSSFSEIPLGSSKIELESNVNVKETSSELLASDENQDSKSDKISRKEGIAKIRQTLKSFSATSTSISVANDSIAKNQSLKQTSSLINTVAIRPSHIGNLPIYSSRFAAINSELAYVYVEVKNESDASNVKQIKGVYGLQVRDGKLLARVGVYTESKLGKRLLNQQLEQLEQKGWSVELALNYNSVNA